MSRVAIAVDPLQVQTATARLRAPSRSRLQLSAAFCDTKPSSPTKDLVTPWPFEDAPNTATLTTVHVLDRTHPVCFVTHDADDGAWQFLCGATNESSDARVVGLKTILEVDPSLAELADLPLGWRAWRAASGQPWRRAASAPQDS